MQSSYAESQTAAVISPDQTLSLLDPDLLTPSDEIIKRDHSGSVEHQERVGNRHRSKFLGRLIPHSDESKKIKQNLSEE